MAEDKKISELTENPSINGSEEIAEERGGSNYKNTFTSVKDWILTFVTNAFIQGLRPIKTVNSESLEGVGDIVINGGVENVTGQGVDNSDPKNPVLSFPDTSQVTETTDKKFVTDAEKVIIGNTSGTNTGDETTSTIQTKRPIKTVNSQSLEGTGNIEISGGGTSSYLYTFESLNDLVNGVINTSVTITHSEGNRYMIIGDNTNGYDYSLYIVSTVSQSIDLGGGLFAKKINSLELKSQNNVGVTANTGNSIVIGDSSQNNGDLGLGSIILGGVTDSQKNKMVGTRDLRMIIGGYDNTITEGTPLDEGGLACVIVGSHHSEIQTNATHGSVFGGSYNIINGGDYHTINGGTLNQIQTPITSSGCSIGGGRSNTISGEITRSCINGGGENEIKSTQSTISGGFSNVIESTGLSGYIGGGRENNIVGNYNTLAGGLRNYTSDSYSTVGGGSDNIASGMYSTVNGGARNQANNYASAVNGGLDNIVNADSSFISGGEQCEVRSGANYSTAKGVWALAKMEAQDVISGGRFSNRGDAQVSTGALRRESTSASPVALRTNGGSGVFLIDDNSTYTFKCLVTAREKGLNDVASFEVTACASRNVGNNTIRIVGTPTITLISSDVGAYLWSMSVTPDIGNQGISINAIGESGKNILWSGRLSIAEVSISI